MEKEKVRFTYKDGNVVGQIKASGMHVGATTMVILQLLALEQFNHEAFVTELKIYFDKLQIHSIADIEEDDCFESAVWVPADLHELKGKSKNKAIADMQPSMKFKGSLFFFYHVVMKLFEVVGSFAKDDPNVMDPMRKYAGMLHVTPMFQIFFQCCKDALEACPDDDGINSDAVAEMFKLQVGDMTSELNFKTVDWSSGDQDPEPSDK